MTAPTVDAPTVAGDKPRSTRQRIDADVERLLLRLAAQGRTFELRSSGWMATTDSCDAALIDAGRGLAVLASLATTS